MSRRLACRVDLSSCDGDKTSYITQQEKLVNSNSKNQDAANKALTKLSAKKLP